MRKAGVVCDALYPPSSGLTKDAMPTYVLRPDINNLSDIGGNPLGPWGFTNHAIDGVGTSYWECVNKAPILEPAAPDITAFIRGSGPFAQGIHWMPHYDPLTVPQCPATGTITRVKVALYCYSTVANKTVSVKVYDDLGGTLYTFTAVPLPLAYGWAIFEASGLAIDMSHLGHGTDGINTSFGPTSPGDRVACFYIELDFAGGVTVLPTIRQLRNTRIRR
jgi:hypothetical protein